MRPLTILLFGAVLAATGAAVAQEATPAQFNIIADDGGRIVNFSLTAKQKARLDALPGKIAVGNLNGDVTVQQFYDLNCPYCREAAADVDALVRGDSKLRLEFVPYAVLSVPSVQGAMIEIAAGRLMTPAQFLDFHQRIYAGRGLVDGARVMAAAAAGGLDRQKVASIANTEATLNILRENATVGGDAKLAVTPAYVVGGVAILGHPGLKSLQRVVASMRACGKVAC